MTLQVSALFQQRWDTRVRLRLQSRGNMLQGTVIPPMRIDGTTFYFLRSGKLNTTPWAGRGSAVNRQISIDDTIPIQSNEWDCPYELYDRDKWMMNASEEQTRQEQAGNAIGRTADQIIYSEIQNAVIPATNIIGDYSQPLNPFMLMQAETLLYQNFTPSDGQIYAAIPPSEYLRLGTYKESSNSEWIGGELPLTKMTKRRTYGSLNIFQGEYDLFTPFVSNSGNPTLTLGATTYNNMFAAGVGDQVRIRIWHKECVGSGYVGEQLRSEWKREADYKRWLVIHTLDGAAKVIEPNGIVELRVNMGFPIDQQVIRTHAA